MEKNMKHMLWTVGMSFGITFLINLGSGLLNALIVASGVGLISVGVVLVMRKLKI